jgi:hypothetical protein
MSDKSFTYMICSDDRINNIAGKGAINENLPAVNEIMEYRINFGGFSEQNDDYMCEVMSFAMTGGFFAANTYWLLYAENLASNGYLLPSLLSRNGSICAIVPLNALQDASIQSDNKTIKFRINNCRIPKLVDFFFLKADYTPALSVTDVNTIANAVQTETRWILTLKMTPIEK